jgi:hypothetical protein
MISTPIRMFSAPISYFLDLTAAQSRECFDCFTGELHACGRGRLRRTARENIIFYFCVEGRPRHTLILKIERRLVRFSSSQDRVNRRVKRAHTIITPLMRTVEPVDRAVGASDESVGASGDGDNDFAFVVHGGEGSP